MDYTALQQGLALWIIFVIAGSLHEWGHAYAAYKLGDMTARDEGRLTINPVQHIDVIGTILIPMMIAMSASGLPMIGWMRPVPFNPRNLDNPQRDEAYISWAGPFMNFLQAMAGTLLLLAIAVFSPQSLSTGLPIGFSVHELIQYFILINLVLGVFNLLPVPPLDGSGILQNFIGFKGREFLQRIAPYGFFIIIGMLMFNRLMPVGWGFPWFIIQPYQFFVATAPFIFTFSMLSLLAAQFLWFRFRVTTNSGEVRMITRERKVQQAEQSVEKKNDRLYSEIKKLTASSGPAEALARLKPLWVEDHNICPPTEYKPADDFCRKCEWFGNCLTRKVESGQKLD